MVDKLPRKQNPNPRGGQWVQTERDAHEAWAQLIIKSPAAARLMHLFTARIGNNNAVVMSYRTMEEAMGCSKSTVRRAVKLLADDRWIEVRRIGERGTVNAYIVNDRVAWSGPRDGIRYSQFSAQVIISDDEQPDKDQIDNQKPLRRLPRMGEIQSPVGDGLPPPSQPDFPGLETDLPAAGYDSDTGEIISE